MKNAFLFLIFSYYLLRIHDIISFSSFYDVDKIKKNTKKVRTK